jgi:hypothetical protein
MECLRGFKPNPDKTEPKGKNEKASFAKPYPAVANARPQAKDAKKIFKSCFKTKLIWPLLVSLAPARKFLAVLRRI